MDDELRNQIEALTPLLAAFQRARDLETVQALVAEHRACYLWDRRLRTHARLFPPHGPRDLRKRLDDHLAANTRHLNAIEERLVNGGKAGIEGLKAIFRTPDVRYRLRVMDEQGVERAVHLRTAPPERTPCLCSSPAPSRPTT